MNIFVHMVQLDMLNAVSEKKVCNGNSENTLVSEYWSVNWNFTIRCLQKIVTDFFRYWKGSFFCIKIYLWSFPYVVEIFQTFELSGWYLFQAQTLTKKGTKYDIEAGTKPRSNKSEDSINHKCSKCILKVTLTFIVVFIYIGYFVAISRSSNLIGNFQDFDVANVTNSPLSGKVLASKYINLTTQNLLKV